ADFVADRADVHANIGDWENAARDYRQAVQIDANLGRAYMGAAWVMATCPDGRYRDDALAVETARKAIALDGESDWRYLDTLAAALANAGKFDEASAAIAKAIAAAPQDQSERLAARKQLYADSQPYRDTARTAQATP
ncbi:MAG: hypothetical protein KDA41_15675, partial [Planctomycetales bacterium]|nr:hypothetical protein [Planctomycetales bacterium]